MSNPSVFSDFISEVENKADTFGNEEGLRYYFLSRLEEVCVTLHLSPTIKVEERLLSGRSDARVGYVVFEFKDPGKLSYFAIQEDALVKLHKYMRSYAAEKKLALSKLAGFATDGKLAAIVVFNQQAKEFVNVDWSGRLLDRPSCFFPIERAAIWFDQTIRVMSKRELTPENLLWDFGPGRELCKASVSVLWQDFRTFKQDKRVSKFYDQWEMLFSTATSKIIPAVKLASAVPLYGLESSALKSEDDVRHLLFVVHTYYALILKLLAIHISDNLKLLGQISLLERVYDDPREGLANAEKNLPLLYANLIEEDVFSWFQAIPSSGVFSCIRKIASLMKNFDVEKINRDVLKRVYQKFIPTKLRKALGEFYTKDWVAELLLKEVGYDGKGRLLDPACGSGTFLAVAISKKKELLKDTEPTEALEEILNSIVGLDINPIAVITARVNYLLSLMDLLQRVNISKPLKIPVYLCDSVITPQESYQNEGMMREYILRRTAIGTVSIPYIEGTTQVVEPSRLLLQGLAEFSKRPTNDFLEAMKWRLGEEIESRYRPKLRTLHELFANLENEGIDGIWARFIENFFAPVLSEPFEFVVGNPPWVAPVHVPKDYRDDVHNVIKDSGFQKPYELNFKKATARFRAAERAYVACLPFTYVALKKYLKPSGKLAFLLTSSLAKTRNAGGWREGMLEKRVIRIVDLTLITDIHEGALCWAFIPILINEKGSEEDNISYCYMTRKGVRKKKETPEERPDLEPIEWSIKSEELRLARKPITPYYGRAPWFTAPPNICSLFRRIQEKGKRLGDTYPIYMGVKPDSISAYQIESISPSQGKFVEAHFEQGERVQIESELIYPLVKGENISPWHFSYKYILVPHQQKENWSPIPEKILQENYRETYEHFERYKSELQNRALFKASTESVKEPAPFYSIMEISSNKTISTKVVFRKHSTQLEAAFVPAELEVPQLGSRITILDTSAYFVAATSREEGLLVTALLNSIPVRAFAYAIAEPKGGAPWKQFFQWTVGVLPIPRYKKNDSLQSSIIKLAEQMTINQQSCETELEKLVQQVYDLSDANVDSLKGYLRTIRGDTSQEKEAQPKV